MDPFFLWLESTAFSTWMRESTSMFAFPAILTAHTIGMGFVAGINAAIALRILGVATAIPMSEVRRFLPVMWLMFWVNAASGVALLIGYPTKALTNPDFYLKLVFIAAGLLVLRQVERRVLNHAGTPDEEVVRRARGFAVASLVCWGGSITAGRLLAYTHHRVLASFGG
jgi:hypothetical protein